MRAGKMLALALLAGAALEGLCGPALAGTWSDLWSTHEQQGQKQLDGNHPGEAARLFSDPKRRAYAEAQAGQYGKAADLLAPMKDADSQYNRGNALARSGKLQDALSAYDAALAASPGNEDVLRNRDLVAKALENQQQGKDGSGKGGKGQQSNGGQSSGGAGDKQSGGKDSGSQDGKSGQAQGQSGQQGQSDQQGQSAQQGQQGQSSQKDPSAQQAQSGQQSQNGNQAQANAQSQAKNGSQSQAGQQNQSGSQQQGANQAAAGQQAQANSLQNGNSATGANAAQAQNPQQPAGAFATNPPGQRDQHNATALQQGQTSGTGTQRGPENMAESPLIKGGVATDSHQSQPRSEQALALDQWLRSIPDDSGELLRRKFQIEHLMKKQGKEP